ncbi:DNA cytosine methyltransferase [Spiroplasma chrysopicola]|uniref:Cytosine-specific methyltransferase n=1 Tax=Spiroplasma chrysopicola DF-1 TaxID=1276227 RepID=R4U2C3_9MOLU|nr:DNA (cytosine-5-)-methyltransferase [Spiroplasma chrysopicola]AGM25507.1 DNA (cytosine-5-)-methyltransferase [Spiroplasma chrysopicola DF-1]
MNKTIKLIEAFGGIGTFRKALENIGFKVETRDYIEWWKYAVDAYNALHNNNQVTKDIKEYDWIVDIFAHGSPCTDFSNAGKQDITKGRSILYMEVLRLIEDLPFKLRPKYIIWENVKNLVSKKFKKYFDYYINKLKELGYSSTWKVLNSKDFGIPQSRERVFVISIKNGEDNTFNWDNLTKQEMKPLKQFLHPITDVDHKLWFTKEKLSKAIDKGYYKTTEWVFNENGFCYLPLSSRKSDNKVGNNITAPLQAHNTQTKVLIPLTSFNCANDIGLTQTRTLCARDYKSPVQILVPLEYEEYSNYWQLPRESDGKAKAINKANGAYNRYWKDDNYLCAMPSSDVRKILIPINNPKFNDRGKTEINVENDYQQESRIYDSSNYKTFIDTLTTNLKSSKIAFPISLKGFTNQGRIKIPHQNYSQVDTVVNENGIVPTLTENHGWSQKIAKELDNELTIEYCQKNNIAIFNINNKLYAIRHLSHIEYWRLMGWEDKDINKVNLPKTKMYFLAGNAIVIQVLEAIFKELLKDKYQSRKEVLKYG